MRTWDDVGIDITKVVGGKTFCPSCHNTRKNKQDRSLSVNVREGWWRCHNYPCTFKGRLDGGSAVPVIKEYKTPDVRPDPVPDQVMSWFEGRGISRSTVEAMGVTFSTEWMPQANGMMEVVCFNYTIDGELINIKFRGPNKEFKMVSGCKLVFYNMDACSGYKEVVIVEGEMDALTYRECGVRNVVSVPNGASKGNMNLEYLDNCWHFFEQFDSIILSVDNDEAGIALMDELARRLGRERCKRVQYPDGIKDANQLLMEQGKLAVMELHSSAKPFPVDGIVTLQDVYEDVQRLYRDGYKPGLKTGKSESMDSLLSFNQETGELWMVTGIPSHGKSEMITDIMANMTISHNFKWGIYSFETEPKTNVTLLMEKISGKAFAHRRNPADRMTPDDAERAMMFIDNHYFFDSDDDDNDYTMDGILEKCRQLVLRYGVRGILIDPWNYVETTMGPGETETQFINRSLSKCKRFCRRYGAHIIIVAHPTKMPKYETGENKGLHVVPTLYSINGSSHFYNKTDNGLCVYRNFKTGNTELHVQKWKRYWLGQIGMCEFAFDVQRRQYIPNETLGAVTLTNQTPERNENQSGRFTEFDFDGSVGPSGTGDGQAAPFRLDTEEDPV